MNDTARPRRWVRAVLSWLLVLAIGAFGAYVVWTLARAHELYAALKDSGRGWTRQVFRPDAELGLSPIPNSAGGEMLPFGSPVPTRFDQDGFRVGETPTPHPRQRPLVLALGCSFTYGAACPAEAAYAPVVARSLGGSALNAGAPGYGLSQMLILARRLIPRHAPDFVLVQYSEWLVTRAQAGYVPSFFGVLPTPFFVPAADGVRLQPPVFPSWELDLPLPRYRYTARGVADYAGFLLSAGLPLLVHDDVSLALVEARRRLGLLPDRAADAEAIVRAVYAEIGALCRAAGARMLIVALGPPPSPERLAELQKHGKRGRRGTGALPRRRHGLPVSLPPRQRRVPERVRPLPGDTARVRGSTSQHARPRPDRRRDREGDRARPGRGSYRTLTRGCSSPTRPSAPASGPRC